MKSAALKKCLKNDDVNPSTLKALEDFVTPVVVAPLPPRVPIAPALLDVPDGLLIGGGSSSDEQHHEPPTVPSESVHGGMAGPSVGVGAAGG